MSIFFICIIASKARLAAAGSEPDTTDATYLEFEVLPDEVNLTDQVNGAITEAFSGDFDVPGYLFGVGPDDYIVPFLYR